MTCAPTMQAEVEALLKHRQKLKVPHTITVATEDGDIWHYSSAMNPMTGVTTTVELKPDSDCAALAARVVANLNAQLEGKAT